CHMVTEYNLNVINTHDKAIWSNFITKHRYNNILFTVPYIERIIVDFSRCGFLEPYHLTSLSCLIEEYSHYKVKISFKFLEYSPLTQYLRDINFLNYWLSAVKDQQNYIPTERKTCLGLWKISEEMIYRYTSLAKNYYETNYIVDKDL